MLALLLNVHAVDKATTLLLWLLVYSLDLADLDQMLTARYEARNNAYDTLNGPESRYCVKSSRVLLMKSRSPPTGDSH